MPSLGPAEILVILVVALLVFGPSKLPEVARQLVRGVREFRRVQQYLSSELHDVVAEFDVSDPVEPSSAARPGGDPVPTLPPLESGPSTEAASGDGRGDAEGPPEASPPPSAGSP